jgi:N utilization substance protein B
MKTKYDPRHKKRVEKVKLLFSYSFRPENREDEDIKEILPIINAAPKLDKLIQEVAPEWPVDRLNKIDLAILRLSTFELLTNLETSAEVIIDEAVELGKEYGGESTAKFVNGVLGSLYPKLRPQKHQENQIKKAK